MTPEVPPDDKVFPMIVGSGASPSLGAPGGVHRIFSCQAGDLRYFLSPEWWGGVGRLALQSFPTSYAPDTGFGIGLCDFNSFFGKFVK